MVADFVNLRAVKFLADQFNVLYLWARVVQRIYFQVDLLDTSRSLCVTGVGFIRVSRSCLSLTASKICNRPFLYPTASWSQPIQSSVWIASSYSGEESSISLTPFQAATLQQILSDVHPLGICVNGFAPRIEGNYHMICKLEQLRVP